MSSLKCRFFSTSRRFLDHYRTLGIPQSASKAQIKSHFYKLSKQHHPDLSKDPQSSEVFRAANEAYSVLSDDRERRAYDRTLRQHEHRLHVGHSSSSSSHHHSHGNWRRKTGGATYAWTPRHPRHSHAPHHPHPPNNASSSSSPSQNTDRWPTYHTLDLLNPIHRRHEEAYRHQDNVLKISGTWRALQVLGVLLVAAWFVHRQNEDRPPPARYRGTSKDQAG